MRAKVLFFGVLRDVAGLASEDAEFPPGASLRSVFDSYADRFPQFRQMASSIVIAHNREFAPLSASLSEGDEVAFLPPVSGGAAQPALLESGAGGHYFCLTH